MFRCFEWVLVKLGASGGTLGLKSGKEPGTKGAQQVEGLGLHSEVCVGLEVRASPQAVKI